MTTAGELVRTWRLRRRMSQLALASAADVSSRHLSFIETGRSRPTSRMLLHLADHLDIPLPDGMAPRIANLGQWRAHLLGRLSREAEATGDPALAELHAELAGYPGGTSVVDPAGLVVPLRYRHGDAELTLFSTTTVFGTPLDVTVSELAIEAFYPDDDSTRAYLEGNRRASPA